MPRTDDSLFIINTTNKEQAVELKKAGTDRFSRKQIAERFALQPYEVLWAE